MFRSILKPKKEKLRISFREALYNRAEVIAKDEKCFIFSKILESNMEAFESSFRPDSVLQTDIEISTNFFESAFPKNVKPKHREKSLDYIRTVLQKYLLEAKRIEKISPSSLGTMPDGRWNKVEGNRYYYTPESYFENATYRGSTCHMHLLPVLDYLFDLDADLFLKRMLLLANYELWLTSIKKNDGYFDSIFIALLVDHKVFQTEWSKNPGGKRGIPVPLSRFCELIRCFVNNTEIPDFAIEPGTGTQFHKSLHLSALGLCERNVEKLAIGIKAVVKLWPRSNLAVWDGARYPFLNIPALSLLRAGHRIGLSVDLPSELTDYRGLVISKDPNSSDLGYSLYPGIESLRESYSISTSELLLGA